ncbi:glycolate oxidase subunit GlcF [Novosphingobium piscinae]|uniref:Glycolate oxidase iron-sulfur subunit n=1 Tax=Novosphingobium piscinae TaxID=1507448 RepID=A0A7X1FZA3_9SPHN|nr:glycolate oxidase subunit GlcF [Novosphingobium piscinae]MBC2669754.1 glycolate oxidase subunit GlcF [Novosphingobium piscinae]
MSERPAGIDLDGAAARIRQCVHCGFCTATCPTYLVTGDELDSPRGRIWLIKDMLAAPDLAPSPRAVHHIDRCLSCLSCTTTCPSGVDYMHLVDAARAHIETRHRRPLGQRLLRAALPALLTRRRLFRLLLRAGRLARPLSRLLPAPLAAMIAMVPATLAAPGLAEQRQALAPAAPRRGRVILHLGCVQPVLRPAIDDAALRLLARHGIEVVITRQSACCGALDHHLGREPAAVAHARANIAAWEAAGPVDAIVITASGCGTVIKDYPALFAQDPDMAARAAAVSGKAVDIAEYLARLPALPSCLAPGVPVAWHSACSLQHGQQVKTAPRALLVAAGFDVRDPVEAHICCGSAGSYAILQPALSATLKARKQAALMATGARIVASSNIGCMGQIAADQLHTVHLVELLDWASGGPIPPGVAAANC